MLSTPHGALGTKLLEASSKVEIYLSTPHGALGTDWVRAEVVVNDDLSTPHGALGTHLYSDMIYKPPAFNSTRCIRNSAR